MCVNLCFGSQAKNLCMTYHYCRCLVEVNFSQIDMWCRVFLWTRYLVHLKRSFVLSTAPLDFFSRMIASLGLQWFLHHCFGYNDTPGLCVGDRQWRHVLSPYCTCNLASLFLLNKPSSGADSQIDCWKMELKMELNAKRICRPAYYGVCSANMLGYTFCMPCFVQRVCVWLYVCTL